MKKRIFGGVLCGCLALLGGVLMMGQVMYKPIAQQRTAFIRLANEQGISVREVTRFAGEQVVWTVEGTHHREGLLLMWIDDKMTKFPLNDTFSEQDMRKQITQTYPQWTLMRLVRGQWQSEWVWEAWLRKGDEAQYVYTRLKDGTPFKAYTLSLHPQ